MIELICLRLEFEADVFVVRQRARETAAALDLDTNDQVRVATAVSELARIVVAEGCSASVVLGVEQLPRPQLSIEVTLDGERGVSDEGLLDAGASAGRLLDAVSVGEGPPQVFSMSKLLPPGANARSEPKLDVERLRGQLLANLVRSPLDELRAQNLELVAALDQLTARQDELIRLNEELTETNQGVLAMYSQLAQELEETNRGVVALYADLDERGVELRAANEAKSRFLAAVSHELRSPLNAVLGLARFLLEPDSEPLSDAQAHQVELIERSSSELLQLVNELLDLAKAESGRVDPKPAPVPIAELCAELRATMRTLVPSNVAFIVDTAEEMGSVQTDAALCTRVLRNLVSNALKYTERGKVRLEVSSVPLTDEVVFRISDTGIGIAAEHQDLVFQDFFQVAHPLQALSRGSGLGLPYAKRVTEALGGRLSLESEVGAGSRFTVTLPRRWPETPTAPTAEPVPAPAHLGTVLVVDDDPGFRTLLRGMLHGLADRVMEADGASDALAVMRRLHPDLVLLDLRMPSGDGKEVLATANLEDDLRDIPIAVVTSVELDGSALRQLSPAFTVVDKSALTSEALLDLIGLVLARRS